MLNNFNLDSLPFVKLEDRNQLPNAAGIYFAVDSKNIVWYVGQAKNINQRWSNQNHHRYDQLYKINKRNPVVLKWYLCENQKDTLNTLEKHFIEKFSPELNYTKVYSRKINPAEIPLRKTLARISKYTLIYGYDENTPDFQIPTVFLKYGISLHRPTYPSSEIKKLFTRDNQRKSDCLRWTCHKRREFGSVWSTKCNGVCIVVRFGDLSKLEQEPEETQLAGVPFLKISDHDFNQHIDSVDLANSIYPNLQPYTEDIIPLLWSKDQEITIPESKIGQGRSRGRQVIISCQAIGKGEFVLRSYENAIEWFGGYEMLGLKQSDQTSWQSNLNRRLYKNQHHKVIAKIPEGDKYRSISAPISASSCEELERRLAKIKRISTLHENAKIETYIPY